MATLAEIRTLCERAGVRIAQQSHRYSLLDTATVMMFVAWELEAAAGSDTMGFAQMDRQLRVSGALHDMNQALQWVQQHRDDAADDEIRRYLSQALGNAQEALSLLE